MAVGGWRGEESVRRLARLATRLFSVPIAFCTSASGARAGEGLELIDGLASLPFDGEAAKSDGIFVVADAEQDPRFRSETFVPGLPRLRFYASAWLNAETGTSASLLSIMDFVPHEFSVKDAALLSDLAVVAQEALACQSQKLQSLRRLAYGVSHDFNNLLTLVAGYSKLVLGSMAQDDPIRENIDEILRAGDRASRLTQQLFRFSGRESRQTIVNLNDMICSVEGTLRRVIGDDIELVSEMGPDLGLVQIDKGQMEAGIVELAVRARDAMPNGGKLVMATSNVSIEQYVIPYFTRPGNFVKVAVTDTGVAMDQSTMEQLFEPFALSGGLGLPTLGAYVEQVGGNIRITSEPGRGSTFEIHIPKYREVQRVQPISPKVSETILVVDDDPVGRELASSMLCGCGYRLILAADGEEALAAARAHNGTIHLIVTDLLMPGMYGTDLVRALKGVRPEIKVLYMTGYNESSRELTELRGSDVLTKPLSSDLLVRKVRQILDRPSPDPLMETQESN